MYTFVSKLVKISKEAYTYNARYIHLPKDIGCIIRCFSHFLISAAFFLLMVIKDVFNLLLCDCVELRPSVMLQHA